MLERAPEAGIFRHHLAETAMRGPAKHISSLFTVPRSLCENVKRDIRFLRRDHSEILFALVY